MLVSQFHREGGYGDMEGVGVQEGEDDLQWVVETKR